MMGNWFKNIGHRIASGFKVMFSQSNSASATATVKAHGEVNGAKLEGHYQNNSQHTNNSKHQKWNDKRHKKIVNKQHKRSSQHSSRKTVDKRKRKLIQKAQTINNNYGQDKRTNTNQRTQKPAENQSIPKGTIQLMKLSAQMSRKATQREDRLKSKLSKVTKQRNHLAKRNRFLEGRDRDRRGPEIQCAPYSRDVSAAELVAREAMSPQMNSKYLRQMQKLGKTHQNDLKRDAKPLQFRSNSVKNRDLRAFAPISLQSYGLDASSGMSSLYGKSAGSSEDSSSSSSSASSESDQPDL